jgi:hypothetical protein
MMLGFWPSLAVAMLVVSAVLPTAYAQYNPVGNPTFSDGVTVLVRFVFGPDFPMWQFTPFTVLEFIILPIIALIAIFWGIMNDVRIFRTRGGKKAQMVIAIAMGVVAGWALLATMRRFLIVGAVWSVFAFISLFFMVAYFALHSLVRRLIRL